MEGVPDEAVESRGKKVKRIYERIQKTLPDIFTAFGT